MKGSLFQKPLELSLDITGESWAQGDLIQGELSIKNHGKETVSLKDYGVFLAWGETKKVRAKQDKAFKLKQVRPFENSVEIQSGETKNLKWALQLEKNCPITHKSGSLYLLFGKQVDLFECGLLQIDVGPQEIINQFLEIIEQFIRFKVKDKKTKGEFIEVKLVPPKSREFAGVDTLYLSVKIHDQQLILNYLFNVKKLAATVAVMTLQKSKLEFTQTLDKKQYLQFGDAPNQEGIIQAVSSIINQAKSKIMY